MQLLVLALMLLMSGKNANIKELKPIIEELGGNGAAEAFKQAEELSGVISAMQTFAGLSSAVNAGGNSGESAVQNNAPDGGEVTDGGGFPLAPIANIADEKITYCLSRYIALGE